MTCWLLERVEKRMLAGLRRQLVLLHLVCCGAPSQDAYLRIRKCCKLAEKEVDLVWA